MSSKCTFVDALVLSVLQVVSFCDAFSSPFFPASVCIPPAYHLQRICTLAPFSKVRPRCPLQHFSMSAESPLPPGDPGWPIVGKTFEFFSDFEGFVRRQASKYGPISRSNFLFRDVVILQGLDAVKFVTSDPVTFPTDYTTAMTTLLSPGVLTLSEGVEHATKRALLSKALSSSAADSYVPAMVRAVDSNIASLQAACDRRDTLVMADIQFETFLRIGCAIIFGDGALSEQSMRRFVAAFRDYSDGFFALPSPLWPPFARALAASKVIVQELEGVIHARREEGRRDEKDVRWAGDVLGTLMVAEDEMGERMTVKELALEIQQLLWLSFDTTTSTSTTFLRQICLDDALRESLQREQTELERSGLSFEEQLREMVRLDAALSEVLRMHPAAPGVFRRSARHAEYGGYRIPAGTQVIANLFLTNRNLEGVETGEEFDASRYLDREGPEMCTFGWGPHACPGGAIARRQLKVYLAKLLRTFELELEEGQYLRFSFIPLIRPASGLRVTLLRRPCQ